MCMVIIYVCFQLDAIERVILFPFSFSFFHTFFFFFSHRKISQKMNIVDWYHVCVYRKTSYKIFTFFYKLLHNWLMSLWKMCIINLRFEEIMHYARETVTYSHDIAGISYLSNHLILWEIPHMFMFTSG